jgi:hypothetical protein
MTIKFTFELSNVHIHIEIAMHNAFTYLYFACIVPVIITFKSRKACVLIHNAQILEHNIGIHN